MKNPRYIAAFTMLELAIVLTIIALVAGMGLTASMGALESSRRAQTENKLNAIEKSLAQYRLLHNRLPCPGMQTVAAGNARYGLESANPGICTGGTPAADYFTFSGYSVVQGAVPAKALGLPDEFMFDGWGRYIEYAVDTQATFKNAFNIIPPYSSCSISVLDASAGARSGDFTTGVTNGAIYTLISYGANGHGGFTKLAARVNASSSNVQEQANCHCTNAAVNSSPTPTFYQREATEDPTGGYNFFDDVVRFKERGQLNTDQDYYKFPPFPGPELFIFSGETVAAAATLTGYHRECATYKAYVTSATSGSRLLTPAGVFTTPAAVNVRGMAFSPDNSRLIVYSSTGCQYYTMTNETLAANSFGGSCPTYNTANRIATSNNGMVAITHGTAPYVRLWKQTSSGYVQVGDAFGTTPTSLYPSAQPTTIALSRNAEYMAVTDSNSGVSTYASVYRNDGNNNYVLMSTQPSGIDNTKTVSVAFSPDGRYYVNTLSFTPFLKLWYISPYDGSFTVTSIPAAAKPSAFTFSNDGQFMAFGVTSVVSAEDAIKVFKIDAGSTNATPTFTAVTFNSNSPIPAFGGSIPYSVTSAAFSADSNNLVIGVMDSAGTRVLKYYFFIRSGVTEYTYVSTLTKGDLRTQFIAFRN